MKKTYINPMVEVVSVQACALLAGSLDVTDNSATKNVSGDYDDSRSAGTWFDEEE